MHLEIHSFTIFLEMSTVIWKVIPTLFFLSSVQVHWALSKSSLERGSVEVVVMQNLLHVAFAGSSALCPLKVAYLQNVFLLHADN